MRVWCLVCLAIFNVLSIFVYLNVSSEGVKAAMRSAFAVNRRADPVRSLNNAELKGKKKGLHKNASLSIRDRIVVAKSLQQKNKSSTGQTKKSKGAEPLSHVSTASHKTKKAKPSLSVNVTGLPEARVSVGIVVLYSALLTH